MVLCVASILVLQFESGAPNANIITGGDALWWAVVTITTVGYGDYFPVTTLGRLTGVSVMFAGVGIIGALASILASLLVPPVKQDPEPEDAGSTSSAAAEPAVAPTPVTPAAPADPGIAGSEAILEQLAQLQAEVRALREAMPGKPD